jgi:hypothetical protein
MVEMIVMLFAVGAGWFLSKLHYDIKQVSARCKLWITFGLLQQALLS